MFCFDFYPSPGEFEKQGGVFRRRRLFPSSWAPFHVFSRFGGRLIHAFVKKKKQRFFGRIVSLISTRHQVYRKKHADKRSRLLHGLHSSLVLPEIRAFTEKLKRGVYLTQAG